MKTIIGINVKKYQEKLKFQKTVIAAVSVSVLALNILLLLLRNEESHLLIYILTVVTDVLYGWFMIAFLELVILPKCRLLDLYGGSISRYEGKVAFVSKDTVKMRKVDCHEIVFGEEECRKLFLPDTLSLSVGDVVAVGVNSGIIVEVYDE